MSKFLTVIAVFLLIGADFGIRLENFALGGTLFLMGVVLTLIWKPVRDHEYNLETKGNMS